MTKGRIGILAVLVTVIGTTFWFGCTQPKPEEQEDRRVKRLAIDNPITINVDGNNNCTQNPRIVGPLSANDTVTYSGVDAHGNPVQVTVHFPDPGFASARLTLPGSPFFTAANNSYQYAVTSGTKSSPAFLTDREAPNQGNVFYFYYSEIEVNGNPCVINAQGMGISIQK